MPSSLRFYVCLIALTSGFHSNCSIVGAQDKSSDVLIKIRSRDSNAARVSIVGSDGKFYAPKDTTVRKLKNGKEYFYTTGDFEVSLPQGEAQFVVSRGLESVVRRLTIDVKKPRLEELISVGKWIYKTKEGWYSGDSHVHLHTGGPIKVTTKDALIAAQAEGLNFVNLCVSNNVGDDIRDADLITGKPHQLSTKNHLLVFGEEMRSMIYGHMQFFGIKKLVEPQYTGFDNTPNHLDFPANYKMAAEAVRQGGLVTYGHPMFKGQGYPFDDDPSKSNAAARELPIDAILNVAQAIDLMSYNSDEDLSAQLWYRLLNCGLKLSACVGTDALLDRNTDPMGGSRVYVKLDEEFSMKSWLEGLAAGRSFVTNGPFALLKVNGKEPGDTVYTKPGRVKVHMHVHSRIPYDEAEILVNGKVVDAAKLQTIDDGKKKDGYIQSLHGSYNIEKSSWVALRVRGGGDDDVFDGPNWAHTSPVYVIVDEKPIRSADDAEYFVAWIDDLIRVVRVRNRYASKADRDQVIKLFRRAQEQFRARAK